jgi:hypothetical protein
VNFINSKVDLKMRCYIEDVKISFLSIYKLFL